MIITYSQIFWKVKFEILIQTIQMLVIMFIVTICLIDSRVTYFQNYFSFLINPFSYMTKNSGQTCKYLNNEKSF